MRRGLHGKRHGDRSTRMGELDLSGGIEALQVHLSKMHPMAPMPGRAGGGLGGRPEGQNQL